MTSASSSSVQTVNVWPMWLDLGNQQFVVVDGAETRRDDKKNMTKRSPLFSPNSQRVAYRQGGWEVVCKCGWNGGK